MLKQIKRFLAGTEGAVVADYVVLCAAMVGISLSSVNSVRYGVGDLSGSIQTALDQARVLMLCTDANGLCDTGGQGGTTGTDTDTGPVVVIDPPIITTPDDSDPIDKDIVRTPDFSDLRVIDADTAKAYLDDLSRLNVDQVKAHLDELGKAFADALDSGDATRAYAAIDQLSLVHFDLAGRDGTDLFASQVQALYYDWVAAARATR